MSTKNFIDYKRRMNGKDVTLNEIYDVIINEKEIGLCIDFTNREIIQLFTPDYKLLDGWKFKIFYEEKR